MTDRSHLSIGEVLSLLQDEFPDVTISKIRFLESQGLLDPERTPSGYRKFYEGDVDQLRWVLTQQREHFLPLKVIKERLDAWLADGVRPPAPDGGDKAGPRGAGAGGPSQASDDDAGEGRGPTETTPSAGAGESGEPGPTTPPDETPPDEGSSEDGGNGSERRRGEPIWMADAAARAARTAPGGTRPPQDDEETLPIGPAARAGSTSSQQPATGMTGDETATRGRPRVLDHGPSSVSLTMEELATAAGLTQSRLGELERFGLIEGRTIGNVTFYDGNALVIAQRCAGLLEHGIEPRHLRMFKVAADREASFFEQLVMPTVKQRGANARQEAHQTLGDLADLSQSLRAALLRHALRDYLA